MGYIRSELKNEIENCDVLLLGPQVRYVLEKQLKWQTI